MLMYNEERGSRPGAYDSEDIGAFRKDNMIKSIMLRPGYEVDLYT